MINFNQSNESPQRIPKLSFYTVIGSYAEKLTFCYHGVENYMKRAKSKMVEKILFFLSESSE